MTTITREDRGERLGVTGDGIVEHARPALPIVRGLGPAIVLAAGALAAIPAGRSMDRFGRVSFTGRASPRPSTSPPWVTGHEPR